MPVLPSFDPHYEATARGANAAIAGFGDMQSLMERKQAMALRQQQVDQQRMEFIAKLPLLQAHATLARVNAAAAVQNATDITNWESRAAVESVDANKEFMDAIQYNAAFDIPAPSELPVDASPEEIAAHDAEVAAQADQGKYATQQTLDARSQKLAALSAKYSYMKNLPQYKGFIATVDKEAAAAHLAAAQNLKLEELMNTAQLRADQSRYGVDARLAGTVYSADSRTAQTGMRDETSLKREGMRGENRLAVADRQGQNQVEKEARSIEYLSQEAVRVEQDAAEAQKSDPALAEVLRKNAANLRDAADKKSVYAGGSPSAPREAGAVVPRKPAPPSDTSPPASVSISIPGSKVAPEDTPATEAAPAVAPTKVDPKATTVKIGGKTYPIYKDKHGKRAYLVDGHYVPIDTE